MATIPLQIQTPKFNDPLDTASKIMSLQGMAQAQQINAQRLEDEKLVAQQRQTDLDAQNTIQSEFLNNGGDYDKTRQSLLSKVPYKYVQQLDNDHYTQQRSMLAMDNERRAKFQADNDLVARGAASILSAPPEQRVALTNSTLANLKDKGVDVSGFQFDPNTGPTDDQLRAVMAGSKYGSDVASYAQRQARAAELADAAKRAKAQAALSDQKEEQAAQQQRIEEASRAYRAVGNEDQHVAWFDNLDPKVKPLFQNFRYYNEDNRDAIEQMPLTGTQLATERNTARARDLTQEQRDEQAKRDEETKRHNEQMEEAAFERIHKPNSSLSKKQRDDKVSALANKVWNESRASGGPELDDAIRNVKQFYEGDQDISDLRGEIISKLNQWKTAGMKPEQIQAQIDKSKGQGSGINALLAAAGKSPSTSPPAGKPQSPAKPVPTPQAAPPSSATRPAPSSSSQKVFPRARLAEFAQKNGISAAEAESGLKAQGYTLQ